MLKELLEKRGKRLADAFGDKYTTKRDERWWAISTYFKRGHESTEEMLLQALEALQFYAEGKHLTERDSDRTFDTDGNEDYIAGKTARDAMESIKQEIEFGELSEK